MASHPRPHFFLSRPDHTITPLIAVDELPDHIRIDGVPATLSQADTQAMMSLGVKERSTRHYDVQIIKSTSVSSSSHEGPIKHTGASGSGPSLNGSVEISLLRTSGKEKEHIEENTADSSSIEVIQRPDLAGEEGETVTVTKAAHGEDEELRSAGVEEWRQKVKVSETQVYLSLNHNVPIQSDMGRPASTLFSLPTTNAATASERSQATRIIVRHVEKPGLFPERKYTAPTGSAPVNATFSSKAVSTSTRCLMTTR